MLKSAPEQAADLARRSGEAMQAIGEKTYCFAGFTLDLRRGSLRSGNAEIELRPKSFLLLRYLVENSGRLVSRDELIKALWPDVIVTDESVTRCVSDVRMALGDSAQRIIKTLAKRGYVLTASVFEPGAPSPSDAATRVVATSSDLRSARSRRASGGAPPTDGFVLQNRRLD